MRKTTIGAAALAGVLVATSTAVLAWGTNQGTEPGDFTEECIVDWTAGSVLDIDLANDDEGYEGLMVDPEGIPVSNYSNGGYIMEVRPEYGNPGIFEVNHWYSSLTTPSVAGTVANFRMPVATDHAITDGLLLVDLPDHITDVTFDAKSSSGNMSLWGAPYDTYTWSDATGAAEAAMLDAAENTWLVTLPDLEAGTGIVLQFSGAVPAGTDLTAPVEAWSFVQGSYVEGDGCTAPEESPTPVEPTPTADPTATASPSVDPSVAPTATVTETPGTPSTTPSASTLPTASATTSGPGVRPGLPSTGR